MDKNTITSNREKLLKTMPEVSDYLMTFSSINKRWGGAITTAMIEIGHMHIDESRLFGPLIQEMSSTKTKYSEIQEKLVDAILFEMVKKVVSEIKDSAKFAINILKRNLFERTADVGYLATDAEIVNFLIMAASETDKGKIRQYADFMRERLSDYRYEYTVYNEIIILDKTGNVRANLDKNSSIKFSSDPLLEQTQSVDLHSSTDSDKYIETFRVSDLRPGKGDVLIYSQKIEDPSNSHSLGTLCLCFDFEDEMKSIFTDLKQGNENMIVAILDENGKVMASNNASVLAAGSNFRIDLENDFGFITIKDKTFLYSIAETDGYQGFYGLTWYGMAMIDTSSAFSKNGNNNRFDKNLLKNLRDFSVELTTIKDQSEGLLDDMKIDSLNGQINAAKSNAAAFVEILHFIESIGGEIDGLFNSAIENMQHTVITSLFNDVQFRAFQGNNIADRNLYERANDVCWWALTPLFRSLLTKNCETGLAKEELDSLTSNLQYINDLYTPYLRLVLADTNGKVIAVSNPPSVLEERFENPGLPKNQEFVGMQIENTLVQKAAGLASSKNYCVSEFEQTPFYGGRATYVYSTAIRDIQNEDRVVGVIQIVFDAEPQFKAMLTDILPKDEKMQVSSGCFGVFADRNKKIISSTNSEFKVGDTLPLDDSYFRHKKGERISAVIDLGGSNYTLGLQVSAGYREFKQEDGYVNDIICMIFIPT